MTWTSTNKKLPPDGHAILVVIQCRCCDAQFQHTGLYDSERGWRIDSVEDCVLAEDGGYYVPTHWKPLDKMPRKAKRAAVQ